MDIFLTLFSADHALFKRWFSQRMISRILVVLLFISFFSFIAIGLYRISDLFFGNLSEFEHYGKETAGYIIHASLLIVFLIGVASAITSSIGLILMPGAELTRLATLPIKPSLVVFWIFTKSILVNMLLLAFAIIPIVSAYGIRFQIFDFGFLFRCLLVLFLIVIISVSVTMPMAIFVAPLIRGKEYLMSIGGMLLFFSLMIFMLKTIFPPTLAQLYEASTVEYQLLFKSLPLNQWFLPSLWLTLIITDAFQASTLVFILFTFLLVFISIQIQIKLMWVAMTRVRSIQLMPKISASSTKIFTQTRFMFIYKDFLSIVRDSKENGYVIFLVSIAVFFFVFLRFGTISQIKNEGWQINLILFTYVWLTFFATSLFLRFLYPIFSRESINASLLFSMPISRIQILLPKVFFGIILSVPVVAFSILVLMILPYTASFRLVIGVILFWVVLALSASQVLMGAINPNFHDGVDAEKVSTSGGGIISLITSGFIIYLGGYVLKNILESTATLNMYIGFMVLIISIIVGLFILARRSLRSFEFSENF
jgi:hypothetical protein